MDLEHPIIRKGNEWLLRENGAEWLTPEEHAATRDNFIGRLDNLHKILSKDPHVLGIAPLIIAICGEIGNNSFDHNLGQWRDEPGVYFAWDTMKSLIVLADRGQGILQTLQRVEPNLQNDREAVEVAFTKVISGRSPERRGNGLKFVKQVVQDNGMKLFFQSGKGALNIKRDPINFHIEGAGKDLPGCLAVLKYLS